MKTMPTRIDGALFEAARAAGEVQSRSAAQQLDHWARIGRELEASATVTHDAIDRVLRGELPYDALPSGAQAVVRVEWEERIGTGISGLDFEREFTESGESWAEAAPDGSTVVRSPADDGQ